MQEYEAFFWFALLCSVVQGAACAIGESSILGFLKGYPGSMIGYFSSGTGFAGIFGTSLLIILAALKIPDWITYLVGVPTVIPYFYAFYWLDKQSKLYKFIPEEKEKLKLSDSETLESEKIEATALENPSNPNNSADNDDYVEPVA